MPKKRKRLPAAQRKKQILLCAVKVFGQSSYRAARVADIAAEAGISEAAVYKYFPSKRSIYLEILKHMSERILIFWQEEVDKEQDALDAMRNMALAYLTRMRSHPDEVRVQFKAIAEVNDGFIAEQLRLDHQNYREFIGKVLKKGIQQGRIREDVDVDALTWIYDAVGVRLNLAKLLSLDEEFNEEILTKILDHVEDSIKA
jgi:AcrR family transcriptional regulator